MLLETAFKAARTINWKEFVQAARPMRRKLGGRALQVMWWAMNTSEKLEIQLTDLHKWMKGRSRLNNELAIRLRAKLAMFSDLIEQIRVKARAVYRDGDPRFQTFCLEALMLECVTLRALKCGVLRVCRQCDGYGVCGCVRA